MKLITLLAAVLFFNAPAFAGSVKLKSSEISVNPSRITDRVVLVDKKGNSGVLVQVIAEQTNGATDVSNTHNIILGISQIGEMSETEASFLISRSMSGLQSAKRVSGGVYQLTFLDASMGNDMKVTVTVDAREAVNKVMKSNCSEFEVCKINASVTLK